MKKILLTSGGTKVPVDRVRHLGNMSHGTFGSRIAWELLEQIRRMQGRIESPDEDIALTFLYADWSLTPFTVDTVVNPTKTSREGAHMNVDRAFNLYDKVKHRYTEVWYKDFNGYANLLEQVVPVHDVVILAAAVSDYLVANYVDGKIRSSEEHHIDLAPAPKLISRVKQWNPKCALIGFKLLVGSTDEQLRLAAQKSVSTNGCELVVANDLDDIVQGEHRLMLVSASHEEIYHTNTQDRNYLARVVANKAWGLL